MDGGNPNRVYAAVDRVEATTNVFEPIISPDRKCIAFRYAYSDGQRVGVVFIDLTNNEYHQVDGLYLRGGVWLDDQRRSGRVVGEKDGSGR